jgi:hypothetical protein
MFTMSYSDTVTFIAVLLFFLVFFDVVFQNHPPTKKDK